MARQEKSGLASSLTLCAWGRLLDFIDKHFLHSFLSDISGARLIRVRLILTDRYDRWKLLPSLCAAMQSSTCAVHVERTTHAGHARDMAAQMDLSTYDVIISVGGDGTFHEVVNGLLLGCLRGQHKLATLPALGTSGPLGWSMLLLLSPRPLSISLCLVRNTV